MDPLQKQIETLNRLLTDPMLIYESKLWGHYITLEDKTDRDCFVLAVVGKLLELQAKLRERQNV